MEFAWRTTKGKRNNNEDSFLAERINQYYVFAVADGLGGHAGGEIASGIAIEELRKTVQRNADIPENVLIRAFENGNNEIFRKNVENAKLKGMGTTLIACIMNNDQCYIAWAGDSRATILDDIVWHTRDHNIAAALLGAGIISEEEALVHPMKNIVTKSLGLEEDIIPETKLFSSNKSTVVLSSDGLHDFVPLRRIEQIIQQQGSDLESAADMLVEEALRMGSDDNITIVLFRSPEKSVEKVILS